MPPSWEKDAIELWVNRTMDAYLQQKQRNGKRLPIYMDGELQKTVVNDRSLRPGGIPSVGEYVSAVLRGIRSDSRIEVVNEMSKIKFRYVGHVPTLSKTALDVIPNSGASMHPMMPSLNSAASQLQAMTIDNSNMRDDTQVSVEDTTINIITYQDVIDAKGTQRRQIDATNGTLLHENNTDESVGEVPEIQSYFRPNIRVKCDTMSSQGLALSSGLHVSTFKECALLGHIMSDEVDDTIDNDHLHVKEMEVFMNTHKPFCFVTIGVQDAGKSHTLSCILESCLVPFYRTVTLKKPMTALVLHYDNNVTSVCESTGLLSPQPDLKNILQSLGKSPRCVPKSDAVVLVSPTFYRQRKKFYGEYCNVQPLLFKWQSLTADHIKIIMGIKHEDSQLYVASLLTLLRNYQRQAMMPTFDHFMEEVRSLCDIGSQKGPLDQRIALLESVIAESVCNEGIRSESLDIDEACAKGIKFIVADFTDPLLSRQEVNGMFQVITEQFRVAHIQGGKILALDEAHKFMDGTSRDGLSDAIVNVARLMRHDGMRLAVSTQSPRALAPELLELVTVAVLHHFHSSDWWKYLQHKIPLEDLAWERILSLNSGEALVYASRHNLKVQGRYGSHILPISIRPRITADRGAAKDNS